LAFLSLGELNGVDLKKRGLGTFTIYVDQYSSQVLNQGDAVLLEAKSFKHRDYDQK